MKFTYDLCVIGGVGRVGLPLSVFFACSGIRTVVLDTNVEYLNKSKKGIFPFREKNGDIYLKKALESGNIVFTDKKEYIERSRNVIITIGTPVDSYLNPDYAMINNFMDEFSDFINNEQLVVLRSTVFPGFTEKFREKLNMRGKKPDIAFCPERIAEGNAFEELEALPQIVSSFNDSGKKRAEELFGSLGCEIIYNRVVEAELIKLFNNVWRYIKFAASNQFFMIADDFDIDFSKIHKSMTYDYPRASDFPSPGFAAGPCLFKDTAQLSSFCRHGFFLGNAAMEINESLPLYVVKKIKIKYGLSGKTVAILGMSFKKGSDNPRDSLSFKLRKILEYECREVLCHDQYMDEYREKTLDSILEVADIVVIVTPHEAYSDIGNRHDCIVDIWNITEKGIKI